MVGCIARGADANDLAADVSHPDSDGIDTIHRVTKAAGKHNFVSWSLLGEERARHDGDPFVGLDEAELLDEA